MEALSTEAVSDDATSFTIDLPVTGQSGIDAAAASVDSLAVRLDLASKASQAASDSVKAAEASYSKAEGGVDKLTRALERVGVAADAQKAKLRVAADLGDTGAVARAEAQVRELARQEEQLASKVVAAKAALDAEASSLDKVRAAATLAAAQEKTLQEVHGKNSEGGEEGFKWEKLERGLGKIGGPLADVGRKVAGLGSGVGKLDKALGDDGPWIVATVGAVALAAAVISITAAIGDGIVKIGLWGVGLADANGTALRLAQGLVRSRDGGVALNAQLNQLTSKLPLTREELSSTAAELANSGYRGKDLANALGYAAERAARLKFGPDFAKQMLTLEQQSKVFHLNLAATFGGLDTSVLMRALQMIVSLFDSSTESGRAMKVVFESIFQPMIDKVAGARFKIEAFFLHIEILALKALIAIKPFGSTILHVGEAFLLGAAIIGGVFAAALAVIVIGIVAVVAAIGALIYGFVKLSEGATNLSLLIVEKFKSISLLEIGKSLIEGLARGIVSGGTAVVAAVEGAATGAIAAAKRALGIHSPSKVFADIGEQTGAGMEQGVSRSAPRVGGALEKMSEPPVQAGSALERVESAPTRAGAAPGGRSSDRAEAPQGSGASLNLAGAHFNFYGVEGAEDAESRFAGVLTRLLEGDAAQIGGMTSPAPVGT